MNDNICPICGSSLVMGWWCPVDKASTEELREMKRINDVFETSPVWIQWLSKFIDWSWNKLGLDKLK